MSINRFRPPKLPHVTVGMAVYNGERFLKESIESVLRQSYENWNLLVVDDGSTDASPDIVSSFRDPRIRLIRLDENHGLPYVRNLIVKEGVGDFLAWLDQDDLSFPSRLRLQVRQMERDPGLVVCGSWVKAFHAHDKFEIPLLQTNPNRASVVEAEKLFKAPFFFSSTMFRMSWFRASNIRFEAKARNNLDFDLWLRIAGISKSRNFARPLVGYRIHPRQFSAQADLAAQMASDALSSVGDFLSHNWSYIWDQDEKEAHSLLMYPQPAGYDGQLDFVASWADKLVELNNEKRIFAPKPFQNVLTARVLKVLMVQPLAEGATRIFLGPAKSRSSRIFTVSPELISYLVQKALNNRILAGLPRRRISS